jgi:hypothetical protein
MTQASHPTFDACRTSASAALQLLVHQQQWREQALKLWQRRLERDRHALEGTLESLHGAQDWNDFSAAAQTVWRDYMSASAALWQEGVTDSMQNAGAWSDAARDMAQHWQASLESLQRVAVESKTGAASPMREWMAAFERAMNGAAAQAAGVANTMAHAANASASGPAAGGARASKKQEAGADGGQHGR